MKPKLLLLFVFVSSVLTISMNAQSWIQGTSKLYVSPTSTNIGIGTTSPDSKLDVNGHVIIDNVASEYTNIKLGHNENDRIYIDNGSSKYYGGGFFFRVHNEDATYDYIDAMVITEDGYVGIGTRQPAYKLAVNGTIRAKEVIVETGWSDFVFEYDYNLRPLSEVEEHINKEGHLPDIPSAKEVEEDGISVGEMNAKLLQKIEELTLYIIEQDKRIVELEKTTK